MEKQAAERSEDNIVFNAMDERILQKPEHDHIGFINSMEDRISQLPQPILHHILSFLSQNDAVRTSVLSKSWRYLWHGRPNVEFRKDHFVGTTEEFLSVLDRTLNRYHNQNLSIQKFMFSTPEEVDSDSVLFLEKWIPMLIPNKGLKTLHFSFHSKELAYFDLPVSFYSNESSAYFDLPLLVFKSESLQELYLRRCKLNRIDIVLFKHLKALSLERVYIKKVTFERLLSSCPLIEELSLSLCEGLRTIKVDKNNRNLRSFKVCGYNYRNVGDKNYRNVRVEMDDVSTIVRLKLRSCSLYRCSKNLYTHLKYLCLSNLKLSTKSLLSFSCNFFPCLEELKLDHCYGFKELQLSSCSIKCLSLTVWLYQPIKVALDVPNIASFEYDGDLPLHISFTTTSNKWKSKIVLGISNYVDLSLWLHELDELLKAVSSQSETSLCIRLLRTEDDYRFIADPNYPIEKVVNHLRSCLGSLCSDFSFLLEEEGKPTQEWNS